MISHMQGGNALSTARSCDAGKDFPFDGVVRARSLINFGNKPHVIAFCQSIYERAVSCQLEVIEGALESKSRYRALFLSPTAILYQ